MGADKALVEVAGIPMVGWVAAALERAGLDVVTVGGPDRVPGYENIADPVNIRGPLAGLAAALEHGGNRPIVMVAVDQPLLRVETVEHLLAIPTHDAVVPRAAGHLQVTCALYRATCLPALRRVAAVNPDASIRDLFSYVNVRYIERDEWMEWGEDGRSWRSVDTPADVTAIEAQTLAARRNDQEDE